MPFNGAGVFTRIYSWVTDQANGILVRADRMDTDTNDIATGLSNCITRDGQSPPTASIPMGGQKITGLASGAVSTDAVNYGQVFTSPTFTTPYAAAMPTLGDNTLLLATTSFVTQTAFATALPNQTGNSGKVVTTNGTTASWSLIGTAGQAIRVNVGGTALEGYTPAAPVGSTIYLANTQGAF